MNAEQYRQAGYRVSMQVSQAEISRAEADVTEAYIAKVMPTYSTTDTDVTAAIMQLAFILLLQRAAVATRSGGKEKTAPSLSENGYPSASDLENADRLLHMIQTEAGVTSTLVDDICGIYYRTRFIAL